MTDKENTCCSCKTDIDLKAITGIFKLPYIVLSNFKILAKILKLPLDEVREKLNWIKDIGKQNWYCEREMYTNMLTDEIETLKLQNEDLKFVMHCMENYKCRCWMNN